MSRNRSIRSPAGELDKDAIVTPLSGLDDDEDRSIAAKGKLTEQIELKFTQNNLRYSAELADIKIEGKTSCDDTSVKAPDAETRAG